MRTVIQALIDFQRPATVAVGQGAAQNLIAAVKRDHLIGACSAAKGWTRVIGFFALRNSTLLIHIVEGPTDIDRRIAWIIDIDHKLIAGMRLGLRYHVMHHALA